MEMKRSFSCLAMIMIVIALSACSPAAAGPQITVEQVWAKPSDIGVDSSAFYLVIKNSGTAADKLIAAKTTACGRLELMDMAMNNGQMEMVTIDGQSIEVPAGGSVELKPGGKHVMCMMKKSEFAVGAKVPVTLVFEKTGEIQVQADIRSQ
jgi:copper(I)-binding protein